MAHLRLARIQSNNAAAAAAVGGRRRVGSNGSYAAAALTRRKRRNTMTNDQMGDHIAGAEVSGESWIKESGFPGAA